jgi:MerR family transcriptional regulator, light-induced transcriptional regulator
MSDLPQKRAPDQFVWSELQGNVFARTAANPSLGDSVEQDMHESSFFEQLMQAAVSHEAIRFDPVIARMREAGISGEVIADEYIPALARTLGAQWCEDEVGFATVTIGTARLQGLLRQLGPEWRADNLAQGNAPGILVIVAAGSNHTLGAMVIAGQMRRRGLSVRLLVGAEPDAIGPVMRQARFDAVMISSTGMESLERLRRIVRAVQQATSLPPPVVIGGKLLELLTQDRADVLSLTGADFMSDDLDEALAMCGIAVDRNVTQKGGIGA